MPYIKDHAMRNNLDIVVEKLHTMFIFKGLTGNFNYLLFKLAKRYCTNYREYRNFIGELECAKAEIERRLIAPYEDKKIKENGDVE